MTALDARILEALRPHSGETTGSAKETHPYTEEAMPQLMVACPGGCGKAWEPTPDGRCPACGFEPEVAPQPDNPDTRTNPVELVWDGKLGKLLDDLATTFRRFLWLGKDEVCFLSLWVAHTWAFEAAEVTPYPGVHSPTRRCGKSTALKLLSKLVRNPELFVNPSDSVIFRCFSDHDGVPTLLLDEADRTFKSPKDRQDLIAMVNAGFEDGATIPRARAETKKGEFSVDRFPVFCPKAFGSIGAIPDDATLDRTVPIKMKRKPRDVRVERARRRVVLSASVPLVQRLRAWRDAGAVDQLADAHPDLPDELDDRAQDFWEPLLAISDLAGGAWPQTARSAALLLSAGRDLTDDSVDTDLLRRCYEAFRGEIERLHTADLIAMVCKDDDSRFRSWWWDEKDHKPNNKAARQLGVRLRKFGIEPEKSPFQIDGVQARGYVRSAFLEAWGQYEIDELDAVPPVSSVNPSTVAANPVPERDSGVDGSEIQPVNLTGSNRNPSTPQTLFQSQKQADVDGLTGYSGGTETGDTAA